MGHEWRLHVHRADPSLSARYCLSDASPRDRLGCQQPHAHVGAFARDPERTTGLPGAAVSRGFAAPRQTWGLPHRALSGAPGMSGITGFISSCGAPLTAHTSTSCSFLARVTTSSVVGTDSLNNGVPQLVRDFADRFESVYAFYTSPPFSYPAPVSGSNRIPVNLTRPTIPFPR